MEFKTYPQLALILILRKQGEKIFEGVLPVTRLKQVITPFEAVNLDAYKRRHNDSDTAGKGYKVKTCKG